MIYLETIRMSYISRNKHYKPLDYIYNRANEKAKIYKDKVNQLNKQVETQREILKEKENQVDELLNRLDDVAKSNKSKSDEINYLKQDTKSLKEEVSTLWPSI